MLRKGCKCAVADYPGNDWKVTHIRKWTDYNWSVEAVCVSGEMEGQHMMLRAKDFVFKKHSPEFYAEIVEGDPSVWS